MLWSKGALLLLVTFLNLQTFQGVYVCVCVHVRT